jgi:hypothetical protein
MRPYYQPRLYIEEADGKTILVIKVSPGERRPYKVPDQITGQAEDVQLITSGITVAVLCLKTSTSAN